MNVLVAGGAGYIGSHTVKRLKEAGHNPVIYDNLSRGHKTTIQILKVPAVAADLNDRPTLLMALREHRIDTVMHFAAYAYVGESVDKPLLYYQNNVATTVNVLQCMQEANVNRFVFSSTCAVYGDVQKMPITEDEKKKPVSPYGRTKLMVEEVLTDYANSNKKFAFALEADDHDLGASAEEHGGHGGDFDVGGAQFVDHIVLLVIDHTKLAEGVHLAAGAGEEIDRGGEAGVNGDFAEVDVADVQVSAGDGDGDDVFGKFGAREFFDDGLPFFFGWSVGGGRFGSDEAGGEEANGDDRCKAFHNDSIISYRAGAGERRNRGGAGNTPRPGFRR